MSEEYGYNPTDLDDELFLSEVPMELLQESIETQFGDPLEYRKKDYVQSFITKYEFSKDNMMEDDLVMLEYNRDKFIEFLEEIFDNYLSIGFNELDNVDTDEQNEIMHQTYRFFIKNIKKNFVNIIFNYINEYKDDISSKYEKKKDVTTLNFRAEIDDEYDTLVLANLGEIVNYIIEIVRDITSVDDFFELCQDDEVILELECVKHYYNEMQLTGNFIEKYVDMLDDDFKSEIQSKIRNKILKKYPYRERKADITDDDIADENKDIEEK